MQKIIQKIITGFLFTTAVFAAEETNEKIIQKPWFEPIKLFFQGQII